MTKRADKVAQLEHELSQLRGEILTVANGDRLLPEAANNLHIIANHIRALVDRNAQLQNEVRALRERDPLDGETVAQLRALLGTMHGGGPVDEVRAVVRARDEALGRARQAEHDREVEAARAERYHRALRALCGVVEREGE